MTNLLPFQEKFIRRNDALPRKNKPISDYVVAVISDAVPERNGVGTYYHDLSHHLRQHVRVVETISPQVQDGRWESAFSLPLPSDNTQRVFVPHFPRLKSRMDELKPDVVIVPTPGLYGLFGAYYGQILGARVLVGFHTRYEKLVELHWDSWQGEAAKSVIALTTKLLFHYADCVLTTADIMVNTALSLGAKEARVIGTPLAFSFINTPVTMPSPEIKKVIFAGRLSAEKNIDEILEAAEALPHIQFSLAGDGGLKPQVTAAARRLPNVNYLGWLSRQALLEQVDAHDMLLLPSHVESFGTVALEAMARQRYTLVSAECGIVYWPELVNGLFIMPAVGCLIETLRKIEALPAERRLQVARQARCAAVSINNKNCASWLDVLQTI